jgi:hypothetical protein
LVAPQGFTDFENKGDMTVFHSDPHAIPHSQNKDSYPDLRRTSSDFFGPVGTATASWEISLMSVTIIAKGRGLIVRRDRQATQRERGPIL